MGRQNYISLLGVVAKPPRIQKNADGEPEIAIVFLKITRPDREVGDRRLSFKDDTPIIFCRDKEFIKETVVNWTVGDIVKLKGVFTTMKIQKGCVCSHCNTPNRFAGILNYINPIHALTITHIADEQQALEFLHKNREISNECHIIGTVIREPKMLHPKAGLTVTQYPIAIGRHFFIKTDAPEIKTDYPWVKAYGENAKEDKAHLKAGSEILVDGCLQARNVTRKSVCSECGKEFEWRDRTMEIVPFATEYLTGTYTAEEIEENEKRRIEQIQRDTFGRSLTKEELEGEPGSDNLTQEDLDAGIDPQAL